MEPYLHISKASDLAHLWDRRFYRFLEILPGLLAWATLITTMVLSFILPVAVAIFIILFDVYWLLKAVYVSLHLRYTYKKMRENMKCDWLSELERLPTQIYNLQSTAYNLKSWKDLYHLVILPMATEPLEVVRESFAGLVKTKYPLNRFIVVLATEERAGEMALSVADAIQKEFGGKFFRFLITKHPHGLAGEVGGKGSNSAWAARDRKSVV